MSLSDIVDGVRAEAGHSLDRATALNDAESLRLQINRTEAWLFHQYEWPQARIYREEMVKAGETIYTFPRRLDPYRIEKVWCSYGTEWVEVMRDISPYDLHVFESTWPILKWQHFQSDNQTEQPQYEVWPVPDRDGERLRFYGTLRVTPMRKDTDRSVLDGNLIIWFTAARMLARQESPDAAIVTQTAENLLQKLRAQQGSMAVDPWVLGGGELKTGLRPGLDYVSRHAR